MKRALCILLFLSTVYRVEAQQDPSKAIFDSKAAERFANLALACVHKEYPNHISHTLNSDADIASPRNLTPAFYGCYDWHSSVHGHWLLVRLIRTYPNAAFVQAARDALRQSLTADHITQEAAYLRGPGRASFERPYGLAWLLQLAAELREWNDPQSKEIAANLYPLEQVALERLNAWLPKLSNPVRIGEHDQTAFGLGLILDYAQSAGDQKFVELLLSKAKQFYLNDKNCPLAYEPSGEDFLSPCLGEADLMRRVLPSREFAAWLRTFMPQIPVAGAAWLEPVVSPDPSDPKLAHLDGLNLSRAWMLNGIASALPNSDKRLAAIKVAAKAHGRAGLAAVTGEHYEGGHWLGSFAVYLVTQRGIPALSQANRAQTIHFIAGQDGGTDLRSGKLVPFIQSRQEDLQRCITCGRRICLLWGVRMSSSAPNTAGPTFQYFCSTANQDRVQGRIGILMMRSSSSAKGEESGP